MIVDLSAGWTPPPTPISRLEFARTIRLPDGPSAGMLWDPDTEPVQRAWLAALDARRHRIAVLIAPSQRGKSLLAIICEMLHASIQRRQDVVYVMPTNDKISQNWTGKIRPAIIGSGFGAWLPDKGPGSRGGRPAAITLRDPTAGDQVATWYFVSAGGSGAETATSSVTAPLVVFDEADDAFSVGQIVLAGKRNESYVGTDDQLYVITSTVNARRSRGASHPILEMYSSHTMRGRMEYMCPYCHGYYALAWESLRWPRGEPSAVAYECRCGARWSESDRHRALDTGRISGLDSSSPGLGLLTWELDYHMGRSMEEIASEYESARVSSDSGDDTTLSTFTRKRLCRKYDSGTDDDIHIPTRLYLASRAEGAPIRLGISEAHKGGDSIHIVVEPPPATFATVGVDVQRGGQSAPGRLYYLVRTEDARGTSYLVGWGTVILSPVGRYPTVQEIHSGLDQLRALLDSRDWGAPIVRAGVDVGDRGEEILPWITSQHGHRWVAIMGHAPTMHAETMDDCDGSIYCRWQQEGRYWLHLTPTATVRGRVHAALLRPMDAAGAQVIPAGVSTTSALVQHLCGTAQIQIGRDVRWSQPTNRDRQLHPEAQLRIDYLDCDCYATALAEHHRHLARVKESRK